MIEDKKERKRRLDRERYHSNKETINAKRREEYRTNPEYSEKAKANAQKYRNENYETYRAYNKAWDEANPEKKKAIRRKHAKANPYQRRAISARRRANKLQAIPKWADNWCINQFYFYACYRTKTEAEKYTVDHVIPLTSDFVCGFHSHTNMQILTQIDNSKKGNLYWPDMPNIYDPELLEVLRQFKLKNKTSET